jgi:hypothetical protein
VIISTAGETEAGSAGEQPARDSRSGCDEYSFRGVKKLPTLTLSLLSILSPLPGSFAINIWSFPNALKNSRRSRGVLNFYASDHSEKGFLFGGLL